MSPAALLRGVTLPLATLVAGGAALRMQLLDAPGYVDEFYSGLAARSVLETGFTLFPSGYYYDRDLLYHYALSGALALGGGGIEAGRWLSLLVGLAVIVLAYHVVSRVAQSKLAGLLAAALVAFDPFTASMTPRMRMYPWLQASSLLLLLAFEREYLSARAAESRWKPRTAVALGFGMVIHQLTVFFLPVLGLFALAKAAREGGEGSAQPLWRRLPIRGAVSAIVALGAIAALGVGMRSLAAEQPGYKGAIIWGGDAHTSPVNAHFAALGPVENLREKIATSAPSRASTAAKAVAWLGVAAVATLAAVRAGGVLGPASRLLLFGWIPLALLIAYPRHELPGRWLVHLSPIFLCGLAAAWASHRAWADSAKLSPPEAVAAPVLGSIGLLAALAVVDPGSVLWKLRYPLLAALLAAGVVAWAVCARRGHRAGPRWAVLSASGAALLWVHMSLGAWWVDNGRWAEAAAAVAPDIAADDFVVVHGENAPSLAWALPRVDAVVPFWRLEYSRGGNGHPDMEIASGAQVLHSVDELLALAAGRKIWYFAGPVTKPPAIEEAQRLYAEVELPLVQWLDSHTELVHSERPAPLVRVGRGPAKPAARF